MILAVFVYDRAPPGFGDWERAHCGALDERGIPAARGWQVVRGPGGAIIGGSRYFSGNVPGGASVGVLRRKREGTLSF